MATKPLTLTLTTLQIRVINNGLRRERDALQARVDELTTPIATTPDQEERNELLVVYERLRLQQASIDDLLAALYV